MVVKADVVGFATLLKRESQRDKNSKRSKVHLNTTAEPPAEDVSFNGIVTHGEIRAFSDSLLQSFIPTLTCFAAFTAGSTCWHYCGEEEL